MLSNFTHQDIVDERIEYRFQSPPGGVSVKRDSIQLLLTARKAQPVPVGIINNNYLHLKINTSANKY